MSVVYAQGPPGGLIRCWRLGVSSFYFEKHRRKPFCESSTDLTQLDRPRHIFLTAEMRSCHFFFRVKFVAETFYFARLFFLSLARSLSAEETVAVRSQWERRRRAFQHAASPPVSTFCCSSPTSFWLTLDASRHISVMRSPTCWLVVVLWVPIGDNGEREYDVSSCQLFVFITLFLKCFSLKNSPNFSTWRVRGGGVKPKMTTRSSNVDTSSHFVFTYNRRKNECWCVFKGLCIWWWWRRLF